jgi:hypothetical protein
MARPSIAFDSLADLEKLRWLELDGYKGAIMETCRQSLSWASYHGPSSLMSELSSRN